MKTENAKIIRGLAQVASAHESLVYQADWHLQGLFYHAQRTRSHYRAVAQEIGDRALGAVADVVVMYSPRMRSLLFEFYAFMNLARITLDQLVRYLGPTFGKVELPNSITDGCGSSGVSHAAGGMPCA